MAKTCEHCKKTYPETQTECPHCTPEVEVLSEDDILDLLEDVDLPDVVDATPSSDAIGGDKPRRSDSSSAIDLGEPGEDDLGGIMPVPDSGTSNVAWASLVEDIEDNLSGQSRAKIDSPSDQDLIPQAFFKDDRSGAPLDEPSLAENADIDLDGQPSDVRLAGGASAVDLGATGGGRGGPVSDVRLLGDAGEDDSSAVDLGAHATGRAGLSSNRLAESESSNVNLGPTVPPASLEDEVDLEELAQVVEDSDEFTEVSEFAEDEGDDDEVTIFDQIAEVEAGSAVNLGEATRGGEGRSSRDLIAEAVESGVDLAGTGASPKASKPDDSAVNLSSVFDDDHLSSPPPVWKGHGSEHEIDLGFGPDEGHAVDMGREASGEADPSALDLDEAATFLAGSGAGMEQTGSSAVDLAGKKGRRNKGDLPDSEVSSGVDLDRPRRPLDADDIEATVSPSDVDLGGSTEPESFEEDLLPEPEPPPPPRRTSRTAAQTPSRLIDEEPEEKPQPKRRGGALVGGLVGALAGAGVMFGLWSGGVEPPIRLGGSPPPRQPMASIPPSGNLPPGPAPGGVPAATPLELLGTGNFAGALTALENAGEEPAVQTQRGSARWLHYLQEQMTRRAPLNAGDEAVQKAQADLGKAAEAKDPEALFYLAQLQEWTAGPDEARKTYGQGLQVHAENPIWKRRFQAALDRLESRVGAAPGKPGPVGQLPGADPDAAAAALASLVIALQPGDAPAEDEEAGYDFWAALKLARANKIPEAIAALEKARKTHETKRFSRLRKAQNPGSDPTEEIFLRSCEELKAYWVLRSSGGGGGASNAADAMALAEARKGLMAAETRAKTAETKAMEAQTQLVEARKTANMARLEAETQISRATEATKAAAAARAEVKGLTDKALMAEAEAKSTQQRLRAAGDRLQAAGVKTDDLAKGIDQLVTDRAGAVQAVDQAVVRLASAGLVPGGKGTEALNKGIDRAVELSQAKDPKGELKTAQVEAAKLRDALASESARLKEALAQRRGPEEMLDLWMPLLNDATPKEAATRAVADAERVAGLPGVKPETLAQARAVQGLALRGLGDYDGSRKALAQALEGAAGAPWAGQVRKAQTDLTDPQARYLPRAETLVAAGRYEEALAVLNEAARVFPKGGGALNAARAVALLETARLKGKGKVGATDAAVTEAKQAAQEAAASGSHQGHYALGRIAEALGDTAAARDAYSKALAAHSERDDTGHRYRMALARVLLRLQPSAPASGAKAELPAGASPEGLAALMILVQLTTQAPAGAEGTDAVRLADEVLASRDATPTMRAQALVIKGQWTQALQTYAEGLRGQVPAESAELLADIVRRHPGLKRGDAPPLVATPQPLIAEAFYGAGLRHYWAHRHEDAEKAFAQAVEADGLDARYHYFLGLSRQHLGRQEEANEDFERAARLELQGRPGRAAVSAALERVQGAQRQQINRHRP